MISLGKKEKSGNKIFSRYLKNSHLEGDLFSSYPQVFIDYLLYFMLDVENISWKNTGMVLTSVEFLRGRQTTNKFEKTKLCI